MAQIDFIFSYHSRKFVSSPFIYSAKGFKKSRYDIMKKKIVPYLIIAFIISLISCNITEPPDPPEPPIIPTTEAVGPGGPAYLFGFIKDYVHPPKPANNTHIYIMNHQDYNDTLIHVFVTSTDASFKITEMPEGIYDVIFMNDNYLCAKVGKLNLKPTG